MLRPRFPFPNHQALPAATRFGIVQPARDQKMQDRVLAREWRQGLIEKRRVGDTRHEELEFWQHTLPVTVVKRPR